MVRNFKLGLIFLSLVLVAVFVLAAIGVPTDLVFKNNATINYDEDGNFAVNWTISSADDVANYSVYIYADGIFYNKSVNNSALGYAFSNSTEANYTFHVAAVNVTDGVEGDNSTNVSIVVDTTEPELVYTTGTAVDNANVSQSWIFVNVTANDTNDANIVFVLYNSTEVNTTVYTYSTTTINWTGLADGVYTYNVTANDSATNINSIATRTLTLDTVNPVASALCSPSSGAAGSVTCSCSGTDTGGSGIDSSLTTASSTPSATGTYTCSVTDYAGNSNASSVNYTITASSSSSSSFAPIYRPSESKLSEGYDISLGKNYQVNFQSAGQDHILKVNNVSATGAIITISSDPITLEVNLLETKKVDLDSDGYYDLSVYLKEIKFSKANFVLTSISEEIIDDDSAVQDDVVGDGEVIQDDAVGDVEADEERSYAVWIIILAIVLVIVGVIYFKKFRE